MGWFDEQVKERMRCDSEAFNDSFMKIADSVLGQKMAIALKEDSIKTKDAIESILKYYKLSVQEVPETVKDMNEQLEYLLRPHGIMKRNVILEKGWHKDACGAMLGRRKDTGAVIALIPDKLGRYRFYDEKRAKETLVTAGNEGEIERDAIAFYMPFPLEKMGISSLLGYIAHTLSVRDIILFVMMTLIAALIGAVMPVFNKWLFSVAIFSKSMQPLNAAAVFMACMLLALLLANMLKSLLMVRIHTRMHIYVEAAVMMRILSLPASFFKKHSAGELANRSSCVSSLCDTIIDSVLTAGWGIIFSVIYLIEMYLFAPSLAAPSLMTIFAMVCVSCISALWQIRISEKRMVLESKESGIAYAIISGIQKIKLTGAHKRAFSKWAKQYSKIAGLTYNVPIFIRVSSVINTAIGLIGIMVIYYEAVKNNVSVPNFYAFSAAYGMVSGGAFALSNMVLSIAKIKPMFRMCAPIMESVPEVAENKAVIDRLCGGIELNHVSFRYTDKMPMVIDDMSLKIRPGEYVGVVGTSGCGKSTLMRLMLGFEMPLKGAVYYDGRDLESIDLRSLRRKIGTVMQDGKLLQGDIFSNITISAPWLTVDDAWDAAEAAGIADDIRNMPMGMYTNISEGQGGISGGQRQRLMIARAIVSKPQILMFDEATSALDNLTQRQVSEALDSLKCTRIVIAHRLSTIRRCDRIIVLDKGHIVEEGTYDSLIEKHGLFAQLVKRQQVDAQTA